MARLAFCRSLVVCVVVLASIASAIGADQKGLSASASAQISALQQEKQNRTPAQRKMDSQLVFILKQKRNQPIAPGVTKLRTNVREDAAGGILVDVQGTVSPQLLEFISRSGGRIISSAPRFREARVSLPPGIIEAVAARADVQFIRAAVPFVTEVGSVTSEGDVTEAVARARLAFGANGTGVKVGVLSDSVDFLAGSQASGNVPTNVVILPGQSGVPASGEGTAMLEIVHDLVPGAQLVFATAGNGAGSFAQNILDLRAFGCDVIVDDVRYASESPLQDGVIARAVNAVTADGALYFASAGNSGNKSDGTSGTWEGDFVDGGAVGAPVDARGGNIHSFGATTYNTITQPGAGLSLFWADPLGASTNDYDVFVLDAAGNNVVGAGNTVQNGSQDPWEFAPILTDTDQRVVVIKVSGDVRFLHIDTGRGRLSINTDGFARGHSAATNAFATAAVDAATSFPTEFVGGAVNPVETFSSDGPRRVFYHENGTPITPGDFMSTGGAVRQYPTIAATDGVTTSVPGFAQFFGTSAAAPHAAAIAALVKSYNPRLNSTEIRQILLSTALDIEAPGIDRDSGYGIVMAFQALQAAPPPGLQLVKTIPTDGNGNSVIEPNECLQLQIVLANLAGTNSYPAQGQLVTTTPGVVVTQPFIAIPSLSATNRYTNAVPLEFSTTADFVCGVPLQFALILTDVLGQTTNLFHLTSGLAGNTPTFVNSTTKRSAIPDFNTNGVESAITVSGVAGAISRVTVSCYITHPQVSDLFLQLVGPDGTTVNLSQNRGFLGQNYGSSCGLENRTTFDDNAPTSITFAAPPFIGSYRPEQALIAFSGKTGAAVNGSWRLRAIDLVETNSGTIECWSLALHPSICDEGGGLCAPDLAVTGTVSTSSAVVGSVITYSLTVTNQGVATATASVLSNPLPANVSFVSAATSQGSCSFVGGAVVCGLGDMAPGQSVDVSVIVSAVNAGTITNRFSVSAALADGWPANNGVAFVTTISQPRPQIVAGVAEITNESYSPATGGIESGETITVNLTMHNVGTAPVAALLCTLQEGAGVQSPSGPQNYGAIPPGGFATRSFTFTGVGAPGSSILAVLKVQDGLQALDDVTYTFGIGAGGSFGNSAPIVINEFGAATPYPSTIVVSGLPGVISRLTVTLNKLSHSWPDDIDALLVGPQGQKLILMSDSGGGVTAVNRTLVFDPLASAPVSNESGLQNGSWLPTNYEGADTFFAPAPAGPYGSSLSSFNGGVPNGTWSLYIMDDSAPDVGTVNGGWSLDISTIIPVNPIANLAVSLAHPQPFPAGELTNYTITVMNHGPSTATNIVVSNSIPAALFAIDTVLSTHGTAAQVGSAVIGQIPSLASGASAVITVRLHLNSVTAFTNTAVVMSPLTDPDLADNSTSVAVTPIRLYPDVAVAVTAAPQPAFVTSNLTFLVSVTNAGPGHAWGVTVTNMLPAGWTFIGATNSKGSTTNEGDLLVCSFGDIAIGSAAFAAITLNAGVAGITTNSFGVATSSIDTNQVNNVALLVSTISPRTPLLVDGGSAIIFEAAPADGGLSPGETVTINFGLRNVGTRDTVNLVATLQNSGGVTPSSGPADYGAVAVNGAIVSRPITFAVSGAGNATATLRLQDGAEDLGSVSFTFPLAVTTSANNSNVIIIPQQGAANIYPSVINVAGLSGVVSKVTLSLNQLSHSFLADVDVLLVSPSGHKVVVLSDIGDSASVNGITLALDDSASAHLPAAGSVSSGIYHPTNYLPNDTFAAPAPAGLYGRALADFVGTTPNGAWSLYISDDAGGDAGRVDGGWTLNISTVMPLGSSSDVSVAGIAPGTTEVNNSLSYTLTVANNGPSTATGVVLTDVLPVGFALTGASVSQGTVIGTAGGLTASLGTLNPGATATVLITGTVTGMNTLTNIAQVTAAQADLVLVNNIAVQTTVISAPVMTVSLSGGDLIISWPAWASDFVLESSAGLSGPWSPVGVSPVVNGDRLEATVPASGAGAFYRLRKP